jgi:hypothetical protein
MESSKEIFYNSYLKKLKRPEFRANRSGSTSQAFNPDDAFGANSVFRSEETNPWAGRDQDNAKFGALGGPSGYKGQPFKLSQGSTSGGVGGSEFTWGDVLSHGKAGVNLPFIPSGEKSTFNTLMEPVMDVGSKYGAKAIMDWMNPKSTMSDLATKIALASEGEVAIPDVAGKLSGMGENALSNFDFTMGKGGDAIKGISEGLTQESTDSLKNIIEGAEEVSDASGSIPYAGTALKIMGDTLSGKMFRRPAESLGSAGGSLGGAAAGATAGSAVFPGVGTALGGALGALLGGRGGGFLGRTFGRLFG